MKQALQHEEQQGGPNPLNAGANPVMLPHNFYEQELRNPRRNNQFAKVSENLINRLPASKIGHQKLQEEMINYDEHKKEEEVEMYKNLLADLGLKVHENLIHKHAFAAKDPQFHPAGRPLSQYSVPTQGDQGGQSLIGIPEEQPEVTVSPQREPSQYQNPQSQPIRAYPLGAAQPIQNGVPRNPEVYIRKVNDSSAPQGFQEASTSPRGGGPGILGPLTQRPVELFQQGLDNYVYDKDDNDVNRRANKAHNLSTHIRFLGAGAPGNNAELERLKQIQKKMIYKSMLDDQVKAKDKERELLRLLLKENELKDLERIQRDNEIQELRKLEEEKLIREKQEKLRQINQDNIKSFKSQQNKQQRRISEIPTTQSQFQSKPHLSAIHQQSQAFAQAQIHSLANQAKKGIQKEADLARDTLVYEKNLLKRDLLAELAKEKEFLATLPDEIRRRIQASMDTELLRLKNEVNNGTNILRDEIIKLRSQAVELDHEKKQATRELHRLRKNLAKIQYNDDIRTHELLNALAEDNLYRLLPSSSKFSMPEALFADDENNTFPISYYDKDRVIKGEAKLYTDAYFEDGARLSDPLYQSLNFDDRGRGALLRNAGSRVVGGGVDWRDERVLNRNSMRNNVLGSIIENQKLWTLEEYLKRDLEDPVNISF